MKMRQAIVIAAALWAAQLSGPAAADLYRWVDPETGSVKFSSYPPPWYGDDSQRRAPRVEHIPARREGAVRPDIAPEGASAASSPLATPEAAKASGPLQLQRKALLQQIGTSAAAAAKGDATRGPSMQKQLEAFVAVSEQLDKLDPEGAAGRRTEAETLLQKLINKQEPR